MDTGCCDRYDAAGYGQVRPLHPRYRTRRPLRQGEVSVRLLHSRQPTASLVGVVLFLLAASEAAAQDSLIFGPIAIFDRGSVNLNDPQMPGISVRFRSSVSAIDTNLARVLYCQMGWVYNFQNKRFKFEPLLTTGDCFSRPFTGPKEALQGLSTDAIASYPKPPNQAPSGGQTGFFSAWYSASSATKNIYLCVVATDTGSPFNSCQRLTQSNQ